MISARIIDNHWINNPILRLVDDDETGLVPEGIWEQTGRVRQAVLDTIVSYSAPSANFIFTHAGIHGDERSARTFRQIAAAAQQRAAALLPVRLLCEEEELARRISTPERREYLKSINVQASLDRSRSASVLDPEHPGTLVNPNFAALQKSG